MEENTSKDIFSDELCILFGNGVSIAYSDALRLDKLSETALEKLAQRDTTDSEIATALQEFAKKLGNESSDKEIRGDFEKIIGKLDTFRAATDELSQLWGDSEENPVQTTTRLTDELYRSGVQTILTDILTASTFTSKSPNGQQLLMLIRAILDLKTKSTICNLNYDTLVLAALLQAKNERLSDTDSKNEVICGMEDYDNDIAATVSAKRDSKIEDVKLKGRCNRIKEKVATTFWKRKCRLVHLHGSLTFWRKDGTSKEIFKVGVGSLREGGDNVNLWQDMLENGATFPAVVLADPAGKSRQIEKHPFKLGYELFRAGLKRSSHWLIAGYSFRDKDVNRLLREEFNNHLEQGRLPKILVIDYCAEADCKAALAMKRISKKTEILETLGQGRYRKLPSWLNVDMGGLKGVTSRDTWTDFTKRITTKN